MVIVDRLEQPENADLLIEVTPLGIVIDVRLVRPLKALIPIVVTSLGIIVFLHPAIKVFDSLSMMALQLLRESYLGLPLLTVIEVKPPHPANALVYSVTAMLVTLLGIVIEDKLLQPQNILVVDNQHLAP